MKFLFACLFLFDIVLGASSDPGVILKEKKICVDESGDTDLLYAPFLDTSSPFQPFLPYSSSSSSSSTSSQSSGAVSSNFSTLDTLAIENDKQLLENNDAAIALVLQNEVFAARNPSRSSLGKVSYSNNIMEEKYERFDFQSGNPCDPSSYLLHKDDKKHGQDQPQKKLSKKMEFNPKDKLETNEQECDITYTLENSDIDPMDASAYEAIQLSMISHEEEEAKKKLDAEQENTVAEKQLRKVTNDKITSPTSSNDISKISQQTKSANFSSGSKTLVYRKVDKKTPKSQQKATEKNGKESTRPTETKFLNRKDVPLIAGQLRMPMQKPCESPLYRIPLNLNFIKQIKVENEGRSKGSVANIRRKIPLNLLIMQEKQREKIVQT